MKRAKQVITGVLIAGLLASFVVAPQAAEAGGRDWGGHGAPRHSHGHSHGYGNPAYFWGGLAAGAVTGIIVGSIFAPRVWAAPVLVQQVPVVVQPVPVVVQPAPVIVQPVCATQWVPTQWNGYQWVPGYWAQVCR